MRLKVTDTRTLADAKPDVRNLEFRVASVTMGSHSSNLLQLPNIEIAAHHATLERVGDGWVYKPTMRDDHTKINGQPVNEPVAIKDGDVISITRFEIKIRLDDDSGFVLPEASRTDELAMIRKYPVPPRTTLKKVDSDASLTPERRKILADFAREIGGCADLPSLLERTVRALGPGLNARMVWIGARKKPSGPLEFVDGRLDGTATMAEPPKLETYLYRCLKRNQYINIPRTGDGVTQSVLAVPIQGEYGAIGLLYVDTKKRTRVFDDADLDFLTVAAALVSPIFRSVLRGGSDALLAALPSDWAVVREVQGRLAPRDLGRWPLFELAYRTIPGTERAGDLCDVIRMPNGLAALLVGRVKAEPPRSAAALSETRGAFRIACLNAQPPRVQLKALNWLLSDEKDPCVLDAAIAVVNPKSGVAEIGTAGQIGAVLIDTKGRPRKLVKSDVPPVGTGQNIEYSGRAFQIKSGETLAFYTPGVETARDESGQTIGEKQFLATLCDGFGQPSGPHLDDLLADVASMLKAGNTEDDITILLGHRPE